jgi:hypothetical protein
VIVGDIKYFNNAKNRIIKYFRGLFRGLKLKNNIVQKSLYCIVSYIQNFFQKYNNRKEKRGKMKKVEKRPLQQKLIFP